MFRHSRRKVSRQARAGTPSRSRSRLGESLEIAPPLSSTRSMMHTPGRGAKPIEKFSHSLRFFLRIGLSPTHTTGGVRVSPRITSLRDAVQPCVGRPLALADESEHCLKRRHRHDAPVEPEGELVQIRLKVLLPHAAVVGAQQPRLEVREDQVDMRQDLRGTLWRALKLSLVLIAAPPQTGVPLPRVRDDRGAFLDHGLDEADELIGRRSANSAQAHTPYLLPANP